MGGINGVEKRMEVVAKFREGHFGVLGLCETKLKGTVREKWDGVDVIRSGVSEDGVAREGVAMMLSEEWNGCMVGGRMREFKSYVGQVQERESKSGSGSGVCTLCCGR